MKAVTSFWSALSRATASEAAAFEVAARSGVTVILLMRFLKLQSPRKEDIIFQVDVLVHVALEVAQALV